MFLYATPTLKFKSATGLKGEGPNEVKMFPMFCHTLDEDFLYIRGYEPYSIRKIKLQEDGSFGGLTENAVYDFQKKAFPNQPNEWDKLVGQKTLKALES